MKNMYKFLFVFLLISNSLFADEATNWLKKEIDYILNAYNNEDLNNIERFNYIEDTVNNNFAGAGIAKFVAGQAWASGDKETKKEYIIIFKRHLALSIASLMQGYSDQEYSLINSKFDESNDVSLIDMEIRNDASSILVTWRVKKSKDRFFVIDLLVADISLVVTKRSEFNSALKKIDYNLQSFNEILHSQNEKSYNRIIE